ncbi:MAG: VOC family protein [Paucibacter sp.]|nr:VOC family protein [Roseateles sp.]
MAAAVVFVADVERVSAFYEAVAGMVRIAADAGYVLLESADLQLTVHALRGDLAVAECPTREEGHIKLCLTVPDLALARGHATAHGGQVWPPEREWELRGLRNFRACDGRDPEGNVFQLRQPLLDAPARLLAVHPVLAARDVMESVRFFEQLGFALAFIDDAGSPRYAALRRDGAELHLQWADAGQWVPGLDRPVYRFLVDDVDGLHQALAGFISQAHTGSPWARPAETPWGTREFHVRDPAGNGLQFYRPL